MEGKGAGREDRKRKVMEKSAKGSAKHNSKVSGKEASRKRMKREAALWGI